MLSGPQQNNQMARPVGFGTAGGDSPVVESMCSRLHMIAEVIELMERLTGTIYLKLYGPTPTQETNQKKVEAPAGIDDQLRDLHSRVTRLQQVLVEISNFIG